MLGYGSRNTPVSSQPAGGSQACLQNSMLKHPAPCEGRGARSHYKLDTYPPHQSRLVGTAILGSSYLAASEMGKQGSTLTSMTSFLQTVLRKPVPNWGMPAYLNGTLVWGSPPRTPAVGSDNQQNHGYCTSISSLSSSVSFQLIALGNTLLFLQLPSDPAQILLMFNVSPVCRSAGGADAAVAACGAKRPAA